MSDLWIWTFLAVHQLHFHVLARRVDRLSDRVDRLSRRIERLEQLEARP